MGGSLPLDICTSPPPFSNGESSTESPLRPGRNQPQLDINGLCRQNGLPGNARKPKAAQPRRLDPRGPQRLREGRGRAGPLRSRRVLRGRHPQRRGYPWPDRSRANPRLRPLPPRPPSPEGSACADSPEVDFFRFRRAQRAWLGSRPRLFAAPAGHGGGGGGGPHARPGAHPGPDRLPGHQRRRRPGVGRRPGERRAHGGSDGGAGEYGLRLPAAAGPGAALPPRLRGLRGTLPAGDRLRPEALRGEAAQQRPGARGRLSGPRAEGPDPPSLRSSPSPSHVEAGWAHRSPPPASSRPLNSSSRKEREANAPPPSAPSHHLLFPAAAFPRFIVPAAALPNPGHPFPLPGPYWGCGSNLAQMPGVLLKDAKVFRCLIIPAKCCFGRSQPVEKHLPGILYAICCSKEEQSKPVSTKYACCLLWAAGNWIQR